MTTFDEAAQRQAEAAMRRHLRWNYVAHVLDGGLFMGAMAFINATTLLPAIVKGLGGPIWLISLTPALMTAGLLLTPILTAHLIERLERYMPLLMVTGVFQRLPYLLAALALLYAAEAHPTLALAAVALAPLLSGVACGVGMTAWLQLFSKTVPAERRSSIFAARFILASVMGLLAGWAVKAILASRPGFEGYGLLHLCTFGALVGSYLVFAMVRERGIPHPVAETALSLRDNLRAIPSLLRGQRPLVIYLVVCVFKNGIFILAPFLAIHARQSLGKPESYLGDLLVAQMAGAIAGNILAAVLGDRLGGKSVIALGQVVFIALSAGAALAESDLAFRAIFFAFGLAMYCQQVGSSVLSLELCGRQQRSTCLALVALINLPSMLVATSLSALIWNGGGRLGHLAALTAGCMVVALAVLIRLPEPRRTRGTAE